MQDNEFEKQVRDRLARMQMDASDTVWQRVDEGLGEKQRRRTWLLWLPLSAAIIAGLIYFVSETTGLRVLDGVAPERAASELLAKKSRNRESSGNTLQEENVLSQGSEAEATGKDAERSAKDNVVTGNNRLAEGNTVRRKAEETRSFENTEAKSRKLPRSLPKRASGERNLSAGTSEASALTKGMSAGSTSRDSTSGERRSIGSSSAERSSPESGPGERSAQKPASFELSSREGSGAAERPLKPMQTASVEKQEQTQINADINLREANLKDFKAARVTISVPVSPDYNTADALRYYDLPALQKLNESTTGGWRWGFAAGIGRSRLTTGNFGALAYSDVSNSPNYSSGNPVNPPAVMPSTLKPATAWSLGVFAERQIDDAVYIKMGTQFTRLATSMRIGSHINQPILLRALSNSQDKSIASYYAAGSSQQYTNSYSFIDLPLSFGFNFARRSRMPFAWEIGISPSFMLASNALHFNQGAGVYFKDNSLFKKSQVGLITALPVSVYNGNKYALSILPTLRYNASNLFLAESRQKKHFLFAGIGISATIKK